MPTRKEQLFTAKRHSTDQNLVSSRVAFKLDRKAGALKPLSPTEKMVCALRKVLTAMSDSDENQCRYYIDGSIKTTKAPVYTQGKAGEPTTYKAAGICKLGVCHPQGHKSSKIIQFELNYRDVKDSRGQADVEYFDPTVIDELPRNTPVNTSML